MKKEFLSELISFMQQKGFIWGPTPEIYGGLAGFYTFAPLGKTLKNNIENTVRSVFSKEEFLEVECPTIMPREVWEASGHLAGFTDPMVTCTKCKASFKAETLVEELSEKKTSDFEKFFKENEVKCPSCGSRLPADIKTHNLMMKTSVGIGTEAYCRPETATTTYLEFLRYYDFFRKKLPFGVFQIGQAYRNEISPRQHLMRTREFTQGEAQIFIFEEQKNKFEKFEKIKSDKLNLWSWKLQDSDKKPELISLSDAIKNKVLKNKAYAYSIWLAHQIFLEIGIPKDRIRLTQHSPDEKAFYADDAWDIEINLNSFGWSEVCGVHDRTNYDLTQHGKYSKTKMDVLNEESGKKSIPHVLEMAFGINRMVFAVLDLMYEKRSQGDGKNVLKLPPHIAPYKVAVYPLVKKDELIDIAKDIYGELSSFMIVKYDEKASIGKRYLRAAETGIPYVITVDFEGLEGNNLTVTLRDRDSEEQTRVKVDELLEIISGLITGQLTFKELQ